MLTLQQEWWTKNIHSMLQGNLYIYEKDKVFALQYRASEEGSKLSYRARLDENKRAKAVITTKASQKYKL